MLSIQRSYDRKPCAYIKSASRVEARWRVVLWQRTVLSQSAEIAGLTVPELKEVLQHEE
jgi:hypothetical protein